jgi:putative ABC transport system ATP-binding protein
MTAALEARDLYRFYHAGEEETLALRGITLSVESGEIVAITGPSGSGKSTLLACLAGLDEPDGGLVHIDGERLSHRSEGERAALRGRSIGVMFQTENLLDHLSVRANVTCAQRLGGRVDRDRADELLADLGLGSRAGASPRELSGGETARAGLAVALANNPAVLLADEPTGELDRGNEQSVLDLIRRAADDGAAVVIVTHSPAVAAHADRQVRMLDGMVTT